MEGVDYFLLYIDFNNWKVILFIGNFIEVKLLEILNYGNLEILKEFMYNDFIDGFLVFYIYFGVFIRNFSYFRIEFRE